MAGAHQSITEDEQDRVNIKEHQIELNDEPLKDV